MVSSDWLSSLKYTEVVEEGSELHGRRQRWTRYWILAGLAGSLLALGIAAGSYAGGAYHWRRLRPGTAVRPFPMEGATGVQLLYEPKPKPHFLKIEGGDCQQHAMVPITDQDTCRMAGTIMGIQDPYVFRTTIDVQKEERCYYFQKDASGPPTLWMGTNDLFAGSFRLLCMSQETADSTHTASLVHSPSVLDAGAPMSWVGCFKTNPRPDSNKAAGSKRHRVEARVQMRHSNTQACAQRCLDKKYALMSLQDNGVCACLTGVPEKYLMVADSSCGHACQKEGSLSPRRYCGTEGKEAVFRINATTMSQGEAWVASTWNTVLKSISYSPVPLKSRKEVANGEPFPDDDFMSPSTKHLWGPNGRHDLKVMRLLGANAVRLYGNDPGLDHGAFLDEAQAQELFVIAGISDYPYLQMKGNCVYTAWDCYSQVRHAYKQNLRRGFLHLSKKRYHPALRTVILMNEPDLKILPSMAPNLFTKVLVSALDAVLDAEKEMGVEGPLPNLTATFSFGLCPSCGIYGIRPGLGQMMALQEAMRHPGSVGYTPKNDLWHAYQTRFENSVNTANTADSFKDLFLDAYDQVMSSVPVFVGEYHAPLATNEQQDLMDIVAMAENSSNSLIGVSFFEYQVRYDKGGDEMLFGMFGLGEKSLATISVGEGKEYDVWCLSPNLPPQIVTTCGKMEHNVRYVVDGSWSYNLSEPVISPELCCSKCVDTPYCRSWTWEHNPVNPAEGSCTPARCWLHGGLPVRRERTVVGRGSVSGLPPVRAIPSLPATAGGTSHRMVSDLLIPTHVAKAYRGPGLDYGRLCSASAVVRMHLTQQQKSC